MRVEFKAAVAVAAATLLLGMSIAPAMAASAPQAVALQVGDAAGTGFYGSYGQEITLQPASMSSIELPKDVITFQAFVRDSDGVMKWLPFRDFEAITLEDTNTVLPFGFRIGVDDAVSLADGTAVTPSFPYLLRAEYLPGGSETTPTPSFSETETVNVFKNGTEKVTFSTSGSVRHAGTRFNFRVSPNAGPGTLRVTVSKAGSSALTYNVATDENGSASATLKLGSKNGTYKVSARFLGNRYGAASKTVAKNVRASH